MNSGVICIFKHIPALCIYGHYFSRHISCKLSSTTISRLRITMGSHVFPAKNIWHSVIQITRSRGTWLSPSAHTVLDRNRDIAYSTLFQFDSIGLGKDKWFHRRLYWERDYLSMLWLQLIHVSEKRPHFFVNWYGQIYPWWIWYEL